MKKYSDWTEKGLKGQVSECTRTSMKALFVERRSRRGWRPNQPEGQKPSGGGWTIRAGTSDNLCGKEEHRAEGREISQTGTSGRLDSWWLSQSLANPLGFTHVGNPQDRIFSSHFKTTGAKFRHRSSSLRSPPPPRHTQRWEIQPHPPPSEWGLDAPDRIQPVLGN